MPFTAREESRFCASGRVLPPVASGSPMPGLPLRHRFPETGGEEPERVCRGQKDLAAEVLASIAAREAASGKVIERGTIAQRLALLGSSPLTHRIRFLLEMPIANPFDFLL